MNFSFLGLCKDGYVFYNYSDYQIGLKYVQDLVAYSQAKAHCGAEGGDLIRIDSILKYDNFKELLGITNCHSQLISKYTFDQTNTKNGDLTYMNNKEVFCT